MILTCPHMLSICFTFLFAATARLLDAVPTVPKAICLLLIVETFVINHHLDIWLSLPLRWEMLRPLAYCYFFQRFLLDVTSIVPACLQPILGWAWLTTKVNNYLYCKQDAAEIRDLDVGIKEARLLQ